MKKFRAGLVGAGYISEFHVAALRRLPQLVDIVGIVDIDPARAAAAAEKLGVKHLPTLESLREAGADVIHVLTPPHVHAAVAMQAMRLGCHVLVEKPLAEDLEECRKVESLAAETGLKVCVNHSLLYDPQVKRALDAIARGKVGKIVSVDILRSSNYPPFGAGPLPPQYRKAGYPFRDLGVHALYLFQAFLGPIEHVEGQWASLGGDRNLAFDEWRAQVRCKHGLGQFQLSWNVRPLQSQIIIQGTKGVMRSDLFLMFQALRTSIPLPKAAERVINALTDSLKPLIDVPLNVIRFATKRVLPYHGLQHLIADFYQALAEGREVPVPVSAAIPVVEWTERVASAADAEYEARVSQFQLSDRVPVLVTGASGSVGRAVVKRLLDEGERVRVFVRRPPERHSLPDDVEVALGDLGDAAAVNRAVRGAETVIHVGAAMTGGWVDHQRSTVEGTRNVLEACLRFGVKKLVHVSSMSVVHWAGDGECQPLDESSPLEPRATERGAYTRAKVEAEKLASQYCRERCLPAIILRPGQIYGRGIPLVTPAVARKMGARWLVLGDGNIRLPLVYIDDVVDGVVRAAQSELRGGEVVQLIDPDTPTQNEVLHRVFGKNAKMLRVPRPVVFTLGKLTEWAFKPLKRSSPLAKYRLQSALAKRIFAGRNAVSLLGWTPRVGTEEGIRRETVSAAVPAAARKSADSSRDDTRGVSRAEGGAEAATERLVFVSGREEAVRT
jgi:predicted dehydrogenase/nucleoside-diphosphate-sugar epimerase